jgi:hypothetical protein
MLKCSASDARSDLGHFCYQEDRLGCDLVLANKVNVGEPQSGNRNTAYHTGYPALLLLILYAIPHKLILNFLCRRTMI